MRPTSDKKAYDAARKELVELLHEQERIEKRLVVVRENIQGLAALCESEGVDVSPSKEAHYLLQSSTLPDEILAILRSIYPAFHRATIIKIKLEKLGHDMSKYQNPLATIHMILRRLMNQGKVETGTNAKGKKLYRATRLTNMVRSTLRWK